MKSNLWKRTLGVALAFGMVLSAVPVTASASGSVAERSVTATQASEAALTNIASDCTITVSGEESGKPATNMVDGDTSTLWTAGSYSWPNQVEIKLPAANTKCVKKVVVILESGFTNRSMDISLSYALNNVTDSLIEVSDSAQTAVLNDGYTYEFTTPQAMSHLYLNLSNPQTDGSTGQFWPAIAEIEVYVDNDAEEEVELEDLATDYTVDGSTITKSFGIEQKIREFTLALATDTTGAEYTYTISGKKSDGTNYQEIATGTIGTSTGNSTADVIVSDLNLGAKEVEFESIQVTFTASNDAAKGKTPQVTGFQALANKATIAVGDEGNIVWKTTDLHTNYNADTVSMVVDGNTSNTWSATQYPAYVDIGFDGEYDLSEIEVYTPSTGYSQYSIYYSKDGQNYSKLAEKTSKDSCPSTGESYSAEGVTASSIRILLEYNSASEKAVLNEVRVMGTKVGEAEDAEFEAPVSYKMSGYDVEITEQDTIEEVQGIVSRNVGEEYVDWFTFVLGEEADQDYYEIEDKDGKIQITGNSGVSMATGLNYYLKYYCNVSITQCGSQVTMPDAIVPVGEKIHKECKVDVRYAYNYCTMSYSMAFWGEDEWRQELDWLALNGVTIVLDITGQEEVWREFLSALGYSHEDIKDYIAGPAYYAWAYMANLSGYGGPVHDSWFTERTELARKNQLIMRKLGMQPILQGYSGMVPTDVVSKASGIYSLSSSDVIAQGTWCSFQRPYMLKTTSEAYEKYAALFYECQKNVYGDITDYYATDPFHEGGNTGGMDSADVSSNVLDSLLEYDEDAVWVIQAWQGNPTASLINGLKGRQDHALVLDLYAEKTPHWSDSSYAGGKEFQNTPWVYCMLNNFGGRMGLHGHMDNLVSGVVEAVNTATSIKGIGITPEGSQNNPVLYDLLFETVWCDDASQDLEEIDTSEWLKNYVRRRYGAESESAYQAMLILEDTVYNSTYNSLGQGAPESYINSRPSTSISAASTWGNAVISYDMEDLEQAAELLLEDYDILKDSDGYLYDLADVLKQVLSNTSQSYHSRMVAALNSGDLEAFTEASDAFLDLIDKVDEVLSTREEFLLGTWVERAKALAEGTDDFTMDLYEFNAKSLVTTWGAYPQCESGGLKDYSNRQWAGLTKDFYKQRWIMWIEQQKAKLAGETTSTINWFEFEWAWARANTEYTTEASGADLQELGEDILTNYSVSSKASKDNYDYPAEDTTVIAGSEETASESTPATNVLDGDSSTIWHTKWSSGNDTSSRENHYLILELKEETEIAGLRYQPRQDGSVNGIITGYEIWTSTDGVTYTKATEGTWDSDSSWKLATFDNTVRAKYVKLVVTDAQSNSSGTFASAAEVRVTLPPVLTESVTIQADQTELKVGDKLTLTATVLPADASDTSLTWSSSDTSVATVSSRGVVTGKGEGTVTIKAEAKDGSGASDTIVLTVTKSDSQMAEEARAELQNLADAGTEKEEAAYTADSWKAYSDVLAEVKALLGKEDATAAQLSEAKAKLASAIAGLKLKETTSSTEKDQTGNNNSTPSTESKEQLAAVGTTGQTKTLKYKVTSSTETKKTVTITGPVSTSAKKLTIPATISINGVAYQVTEIKAKAFTKCKKLTRVTIGSKVTKIGKKAFYGCKKLKKVTIKSKVLKTIGKQAFGGISTKAKITLPKKKYTAYVKLLKKAKLAKSVKVVKK